MSGPDVTYNPKPGDPVGSFTIQSDGTTAPGGDSYIVQAQSPSPREVKLEQMVYYLLGHIDSDHLRDGREPVLGWIREELPAWKKE